MEMELHRILNKSVDLDATDVHIDLNKSCCRIEYKRFKHSLESEEYQYGKEIINFLRYFSNLDLTKGLLPQSGSFRYVVQNEEYFFRFSIITSLFREVGVLRVLNTNKKMSLLSCVKSTFLYEDLLGYGNQTNGLLIFSGNTGSGKSTTMFTLLSELKHRKIYTLEDPIERFYDNLVQLQLNHAQGFDFNVGIKQLLRQDPEIIVIGEIRDSGELRSAIRCALTGHLVMATLHASSKSLTWNRMLELGTTKEELRQILKMILYQRIDMNVMEPIFELFKSNH